jgi:hypothetical protein
MNILLGVFFILHGLIHAGYLTPKPNDANYPFTFEDGWFESLAGTSAGVIGYALAAVAVFSFAVAGLGVMGVPGLDGVLRWVVVAGSVASLALLLLFWHNWLILGVVIDLALLYGVFYLKWSFLN